MRLRNLIIGLAISAAACGPGADPGAGSTPKNYNVITAEELSDPEIAIGDALAAVKKLRPQFLVRRGTINGTTASAGTVQLSLNGGSLSPVEDMTRLRPGDIKEIRFLSDIDAAQRYGTNARNGPVIFVLTK